MSDNVLFLDIENTPILGYTWGMYDTDVLHTLHTSSILSIAWKWMSDHSVTVKTVTARKPLDDTKLVHKLWDLLDKADVVIAHNGDSFDIKIINARFVTHGLHPPSHFQTIDTLKVARKYFRFATNKLDNLGGYLGVGHKAETGGFQLWLDCMQGNSFALRKMSIYNQKDVDLLEKVYYKLRSFINNHPDMVSLRGGVRTTECGTCGSTNTVKRGMRRTKAGQYQRYFCGSCGSWSSGPYERVK